MPSNITKFGSLKGSAEHLEDDDGRFGLRSTELYNNPEAPAGEHYYFIPGAYTWVCPPGISSISVVCIGGGGGASQNNFISGLPFSGSGGGGGTLAYKNNIAVVAGQGYDLFVGAGGAAQASSGTNPPTTFGGDGETSWFNNTSTVAAGGGHGGGAWPFHGAFTQAAAPVGDGGGRGGLSNNSSGHPIANGIAGAGGAGGYAGDGGGWIAGAPFSSPVHVPAQANSGAGEAGFVGFDIALSNRNQNSGPGGGVGVYGLGTTATQFGEAGSNGRHASLPAPTPAFKAVFSASLGTWDSTPPPLTQRTPTWFVNGVGNPPEHNDANNSRAGIHGGGGGNQGLYPYVANINSQLGYNYGLPSAGGNGAVRIIWGTSAVPRTFPSTNTEESFSVTVQNN